MANMGERIRQMRKKNNLTQEELGKKLNMQKSGVAKWENGVINNIKRDTIEEMARIFGCNPVWLMGYDISDDELIQKIHQLPEADKEIISSMIDRMLDK